MYPTRREKCGVYVRKFGKRMFHLEQSSIPRLAPYKSSMRRAWAQSVGMWR